MTFATIEISRDSGRPVELLQITFSQQQWNFASSEVAVVKDSVTYTPMQIKHGSIPSTSNATKGSLDISIPGSSEVGDLFRVRPPSEVVTVTLFAEHHLDAEFQTIWKGRIVNVDWSGPWLVLTTESVFTSLRRVGLRRLYSAQCPHVLYSKQCGLDRSAFRLDGVAAVISGTDVTVPASASSATGFYAGGYMTWANNETGAVEHQMIQSSGSGVISLVSRPVGLTISAPVELYPGCSHTLSTCHEKFDNSLNFGGQPFIPRKNPFSGVSLY